MEYCKEIIQKDLMLKNSTVGKFVLNLTCPKWSTQICINLTQDEHVKK